MKNKKLLTFTLAATVAVASLFAFGACSVVSDSASDSTSEVTDYKVLESSQELVVFTVTGNVMSLKDSTSVYDYMAELQKFGELTFAISDGLITSVNGVENPSDFSSCWMVYTDLGELDGVAYSNADWGTYTYGEKTYDSAAYGVTALPAVEGYTYILHYDTF